MIVVKVGGSLFDHPALARGLRAYLRSLLAASPGCHSVSSPDVVTAAGRAAVSVSPQVLLVPGGGPVVDAVRLFDRIHQLGEEAAHWLALRALTVTAELLQRLLAAEPTEAGIEPWPVRVVDVFAFAREDEERPDRLPHAWQVTTDSLAARIAGVYGASQLILLKSIDIPPATPWSEAAARGWVDEYFPLIAAQLPSPIETINFRSWLERFA